MADADQRGDVTCPIPWNGLVHNQQAVFFERGYQRIHDRWCEMHCAAGPASPANARLRV